MRVEPLLVALLLLGCRPDPVHPTGDEAVVPLGGASLGTINGHTITDQEAKLFAETNPDATVDALVARELLVEEAVRSGKDVELARKRAMVRALLEDEIEGKVSKADIPEKRMKEERARAASELRDFDGFSVSTLRIGPKPLFSKTPPTNPVETARLKHEARAELERIITAIPKTDAVAAMEALDVGPKEGLIVDLRHTEKLLAEAETRRPEGWIASPQLARQVATLPDGGRSDVVESPRTVMIVVRRGAITASPPDPDAVEKLATERALLTTRREKLEQYVARLTAAAPVAVYPKALEAGP